MPFVNRNSDGEIIAVAAEKNQECCEPIGIDDPGLQLFIQTMSSDNRSKMTESDLDFVRVVEDLVDLLISKNYILFTELPEKAQEKMRNRQALRGKMNSRLDLLPEDDELF